MIGGHRKEGGRLTEEEGGEGGERGGKEEKEENKENECEGKGRRFVRGE